MSILACLFFACTSTSHQPVSQHQFNFKGFSTIVHDDAFDENDNHLLVGEIRAVETEEKNRDPHINKIFDLKGYHGDERMGIIITTDEDYNILQIAQSFIGKKVVYEHSKKQFTICANFLGYLSVGDNSFSAWQPVIIQFDLALKGKAYFIQKPYSCILDDMVIENNDLLLFTRSDFDQEGKLRSDEKAEVIRVSTSKFYSDSTMRWKQILAPISTLETPYDDIGEITLSNISKVDNAYYFATSNLDQSSLKNVNHLYQLKDNNLTELPQFSDYLKWNTTGYSDWININEFVVSSSKSYLVLTHEGASNKEMVFCKTDTNFNKLLFKDIPLNDYADFNKMLVLSDGSIMILMANNRETWSYFLYDSNMHLIKEINSTISKEYYPNGLKAIADRQIECIFYIDHVDQKDCILQTINLD